MADVFARAAVRKRGIQRPLVSDVGDREKRSATVKKLRKCTKILDKLELGEKKQVPGDLFFAPFLPQKRKKQVPGGLVFSTLSPKNGKTSPQGTCCQSPLSHLIRLCRLREATRTNVF